MRHSPFQARKGVWRQLADCSIGNRGQLHPITPANTELTSLKTDRGVLGLRRTLLQKQTSPRRWNYTGESVSEWPDPQNNGRSLMLIIVTLYWRLPDRQIVQLKLYRLKLNTKLTIHQLENLIKNWFLCFSLFLKIIINLFWCLRYPCYLWIFY